MKGLKTIYYYPIIQKLEKRWTKETFVKNKMFKTLIYQTIFCSLYRMFLFSLYEITVVISDLHSIYI